MDWNPDSAAAAAIAAVAAAAATDDAATTTLDAQLRELLFRFPCAVLQGVRWSALGRAHRERYSSQGLPSFLSPGAQALRATLADCAEFGGFHAKPGTEGWVRLRDSSILSYTPGSESPPLACWPLLSQGLGDIVRCHGIPEKAEDLGLQLPSPEVNVVLLSRLKPLLRKHWDPGFEERGVGYYNETGTYVNVKKMKHLIASVLKWRAERLGMGLHSLVEAALEAPLAMVFSSRHNDMLLCCPQWSAPPGVPCLGLGLGLPPPSSWDLSMSGNSLGVFHVDPQWMPQHQEQHLFPSNKCQDMLQKPRQNQLQMVDEQDFEKEDEQDLQFQPQSKDDNPQAAAVVVPRRRLEPALEQTVASSTGAGGAGEVGEGGREGQGGKAEAEACPPLHPPPSLRPKSWADCQEDEEEQHPERAAPFCSPPQVRSTQGLAAGSATKTGHKATPSPSPSQRLVESTPQQRAVVLERENQGLRIENAELKKRVRFGSDFLHKEIRRLRIENAELKKRLNATASQSAGPMQQVWVPVVTHFGPAPQHQQHQQMQQQHQQQLQQQHPHQANHSQQPQQQPQVGSAAPTQPAGTSGAGGAPAGCSGMGNGMSAVIGSTGHLVSVESGQCSPGTGSVTPTVAQGFCYMPMAAGIVSPTAQCWPSSVGPLMAMPIGPGGMHPVMSPQSDTSHQMRLLPRSLLSNSEDVSRQSHSIASPGAGGGGGATPGVGQQLNCYEGYVVASTATAAAMSAADASAKQMPTPDDRWVSIPSGIVERQVAQIQSRGSGMVPVPSQQGNFYPQNFSGHGQHGGAAVPSNGQQVPQQESIHLNSDLSDISHNDGEIVNLNQMEDDDTDEDQLSVRSRAQSM